MKQEKTEILYLLEGDELSEKLKEDAKKAKFKGHIVVLSMEEAYLERIPLPLLLSGSDAYVRPFIRDYFKPSKSDSK